MTDKSYIDWYSMTDAGLSQIIGNFIKHHRLEQNKTQIQVANDAGLSRSTLSLLERGGTVTLTTLLQVLRVLDLLNVMDVFKIQRQISPLRLAKLEKQNRKRARSTQQGETKSEW